MNLIEKLGLEKCKQIVDGAPEGCEGVVISNQGKVIYFKNAVFGLAYYSGKNFWIVANPEAQKYLIRLEDIRAALADHDRIDTCSDIRNHISPNTKVIEHE